MVAVAHPVPGHIASAADRLVSQEFIAGPWDCGKNVPD
jgi:hypothetical protein